MHIGRRISDADQAEDMPLTWSLRACIGPLRLKFASAEFRRQENCADSVLEVATLG
jgi:hypothetical protein